MKKIYLLLLAFTLAGTAINAQCVVDNNDTVLGISPPDSLFPAIIRGVALDNSYVAQVYCPSTLSFSGITATIYWIDISSVSGFPTGITYARNPNKDTIYGGGHQCMQLSGTTNDPGGTYPLTFDGFIKVNTAFTGDTVFPISFINAISQSQGGPSFGYTLTEIDPNGIHNINSLIADAMQVVPNPNNGQFNLKLNYHGRLEGEVRVMDIAGRVVFQQPLQTDGFYSTNINLNGMPRGMYCVQVKTEAGIASKNVSVE